MYYIVFFDKLPAIFTYYWIVTKITIKFIKEYAKFINRLEEM